MKKRLCVLTMIGGIDVIGELDTGTPATRFYRPCLVKLQPPSNLQLVDLLRGPFMAGEFLEVNMAAVLWISEPSRQISSAYQSMRAGLLLPGAQPEGMNQ
jgi:hypothetical protein